MLIFLSMVDYPRLLSIEFGSGYEVGDTLGIQSANIGGGSSITVTVSAIENSYYRNYYIIDNF